MSKKTRDFVHHGVIAQNRRARYDYFIEDKFEAGLVLVGTEVKALRHRLANIQESYASVESDGIYLINAYISYHQPQGHFLHEERRKRQLLLKKKEMKRLCDQVKKKGATLIPLSIYFNKRGIAKLEVALASGKRQVDKRQTIKERDWKRSQSRLLKS